MWFAVVLTSRQRLDRALLLLAPTGLLTVRLHVGLVAFALAEAEGRSIHRRGVRLYRGPCYMMQCFGEVGHAMRGEFERWTTLESLLHLESAQMSTHAPAAGLQPVESGLPRQLAPIPDAHAFFQLKVPPESLH